MRDLWLIARYEFWRVVRQRRFLFFALGMPLFFVAVSAVPVLVEVAQGQRQVGYVDQSGLLADPIQPESGDDLIEVRLIPYATEEEGRAALEREEIESLWIIPQDYLQTGRVRSVARGEASGAQRRAVADLLRANLLRDLSPEAAERVQDPAHISFYALDSGRRVRQGIELVFALLVPIGLAVAFALSVAFSSGFLAQAIAEEKENRLLEILVTSTRVWSLLGGKVLGLGAVALSQIAFWGAGLLLAAFIFYLRGEFPSGLPIPWDILAWSLAFFILAYGLYATLMVGIGVFMGEAREAQQVSGFLGILAIVPIWFTAPIIDDPSGTVARVFTYVPFTAPTMVPIRMALSEITLPEILISLALLAASVALALLAVSALYRSALQRFGARLSINDILGSLRRAS